MLKFMDSLPLNGYKTYVCVGLAALVLGLMQLGILDSTIGELALKWIALFGGLSVAHKIDKRARGE